MDNLTLTFKELKFDNAKVLSFLKDKNARHSQKPDYGIEFVRSVGRYRSKWLFKIDLESGTIRCSGGPTTTFFGFNAWVSLNEPVQMKAIVGLLHKKLAAIKGVTFPKTVDPEINRIEVTHLYPFRDIEEIRTAELAIYESLVVRYPGRVQISGATYEVPGTLRVGLTKSSSILRIYPESTKFLKKPSHVPQGKWTLLQNALEHCVRVECIFSDTQLKRAELSVASAWVGDRVNAALKPLVDRRMKHAGLTGGVHFELEQLKELIAVHPRKKPHQLLQRWIKGEKLETNGTWTVAQSIAKKHGATLTRPLEQQVRLFHGYTEYFARGQIVVLPVHLRDDKDLFNRWWEVADTV